MIVAPYETKRKNYDKVLEHTIDLIKSTMVDGEDDFLTLVCGTTGTGKSNLMLWIMEQYLGESASVEYLGLDRNDFANALQKTKNKVLPRFCANDEANISRRDHSTQYNKDLIDLYSSIRGLQIFHCWCNPSINMLDKPFIEERIKGVIFIANKEKIRPRIYYYFRKQDLLRIWEKYESLNLDLLKRIGKKYAFFRGWFRPYKGRLLKAYLAKKDSRMDDKVELFAEKYGDQLYLAPGQMARKLGVSRSTIIRWEEILKEKKEIQQGEIEMGLTGRRYPIRFYELFKKMGRCNANN
jgi:hypothetical protein